MKFTINSKALFSAASVAEKSMRGKTLIPILQNFLLVLGADGLLTVSGTNLEVVGVASVPTLVHDGEGTFLVDAKKMSSLLKTFPDQPLTVDVRQSQSGSVVSISSSDGQYEINSAGSPSEYPNTGEEGASDCAEMDKGTFLFCLNKVAPFSASEDDLRLILATVNVSIKSGKAEFAATDAHICCHLPADVRCKSEANFSIPIAAVNTIRQSLKDGDGNVSLSWSGTIGAKRGFISVSDGYAKITARLTDSEQSYPNYMAVYPTSYIYSATLSKMDFVSKLKRLMVCSDDACRLLRMQVGGESVRLDFNGAYNGFSGVETISPSNVDYDNTGGTMEVGFDVRQMLLLAENISGDDLKLEVASPSSPVSISDTDEDGARQIVMPLILN